MSTAQWFPNTPAGRLKALAQRIRETPYLMWSDDYPRVAREGAVEIDRLERENAALRELLNEPYQFFRFGHKALFPWGKFLDRWCKRAEKLGFKKEVKP